jgi:RNase P subunit RPR2
MENSKFNDLVEILLEPRARDSLQKKYDHSDHIYRESSIKLAPRGQLMPCEDCGDLVKNRVVEYAVYSLGTKNQHWKKCCRECGQKDRISHPLKKPG